MDLKMKGNVMSGVRLSRAYLPRMLEKNWGHIVFISSESALNIPPEEVAAMVAYICSPLSSATNGAALRVDGGLVRSIP